ncbi:hypothetical protein CJU89_5103 [Yarrowia sp. B02]|nr:hypothetical protein CJU89_5103 [Yarrowia sp. B02]
MSDTNTPVVNDENYDANTPTRYRADSSFSPLKLVAGHNIEHATPNKSSSYFENADSDFEKPDSDSDCSDDVRGHAMHFPHSAKISVMVEDDFDSNKFCSDSDTNSDSDCSFYGNSEAAFKAIRPNKSPSFSAKTRGHLNEDDSCDSDASKEFHSSFEDFRVTRGSFDPDRSLEHLDDYDVSAILADPGLRLSCNHVVRVAKPGFVSGKARKEPSVDLEESLDEYEVSEWSRDFIECMERALKSPEPGSEQERDPLAPGKPQPPVKWRHLLSGLDCPDILEFLSGECSTFPSDLDDSYEI